MRATRSTAIQDPATAQSDDLVALAKAELAGIGPLIRAATDEGREVDLSHLLARRSIIEARLDRARRDVDTSYLDGLQAYLVGAQAHLEQVAAEQAPVARAAREQLAASEAAVAAAQVAVVSARFEVERVTLAKPDWWWEEQGMLPPGRPPIADKVLGEFELSKFGKSYRRDYGRTGMGGGGIER